jgi:hypothetical protein
MQQIDARVCRIGEDFDICAGGRRAGHLLVFIRLLSRAAESSTRTGRGRLLSSVLRGTEDIFLISVGGARGIPPFSSTPVSVMD